MNGENYIPLEGEGGARDRAPRSGGYRESRREREDRMNRGMERGGDREDRAPRGDRDRDRDRDRERDRDRDRNRDSNRDGNREERRRRSRSPRRRPSRSPGHRRREETDTYSSSRDYRAKEREDRYRDRRDDGWDRGDRGDRGARRDRGDEHDRPPRRDRDLLDDRRRGPPRRDERERKKSASPAPRKPKEPTPDLTDVVSVLERRRRLTQWDIKPPGYENVTAEQAKLSGMFPLPGAPRQQPMDPSRLQAFMNQPAGSVNASALRPSNARQSKRLFVYNVPPGITEEALAEFFNNQLNELNLISGQNPCVSAKLTKDRSYAMLEFKEGEEATVALALDGTTMAEHEAMDTSNGTSNGTSHKGLDIRRPKDYIAPIVDKDEENLPTFDHVPDSPNKLMITNIPAGLDDEQMLTLLKVFGEVKSFSMAKDRSSGESRGFAFCEYADDENTKVALEGLNNMDLAGQLLQIKRASVGLKQAADMALGASAMSMLANTESSDMDAGRVLQLLNMVTPEELMDNDEYTEIVEDIREECSKYGALIDVKIPRPAGARQNPGVGKIFLKYEEAASAKKALAALAGRKFSDRTVVATFFGEEYFDVDAF